MKIRLLNGYKGRASNFEFVPAGEYDDSHPAIGNKLNYLVDSGHAEWIETPKTAAPPAEDAPLEEDKNRTRRSRKTDEGDDGDTSVS